MACHWRIRHKLMLGLGLVVAVLALLLAGTLKGLLSYRATVGTITSRLEELKAADRIRANVKVLAEPSPALTNQVAALREKMRDARLALDKYENTLQETIDRGRDPDNGFREQEQVKGIKENFTRLEEALRAAEALYITVYGETRSDRPRVSALVDPQDDDLLAEGSPVKKAIDILITSANDLNNVIYSDLHLRVHMSRRDYKWAFTIVLSTMGVGVVLMVGLLRFFYRWVFFPIRDLQQGVGRVARGDFEHRIAVKSGDEIEDLAEAFNDMTGQLQEMYRDLARQVNERSRQLVRSERLASVGFLAAGVAHEINNPLASIAFCSEALERRLTELLKARLAGGLSPEKAGEERDVVTKYLKMIQEEAFRCKEITQRLLEFSRGGERRREPTDLGDIVQSVLDMVQHLQNGRGKELVFQPGERLLAWVNAQEIKSVVLNLVVNALDSMDEGGRLAITSRLRDGMAELVFQDTGCGMTPEVLENIFEPFFTRSRTGKGTGLGLSISHRVISQHGGDIEASSPGLNQGSTFTVRLPLKPVEEPREESEGKPALLPLTADQDRQAA